MPSTVTLCFPGQGSQYVGMGKQFNQESKSFEILRKADQAIDLNLTQLMFEGPSEKLKETCITQPAIVAYSVAMFEKLRSKLDHYQLQIDAVLGHSVGEYSALVASGALKLEDAIELVHHRGKFMQEATPVGVGTMVAILRANSEIISWACQEASTSESIVSPANFNDPKQTVISGHKEACIRAQELIKEKESKMRAIELQVSAPFHCPLMAPAAEKLAKLLQKIPFEPLQYPYIANIDAQKYSQQTNAETIKNNLVEQICGSVLWSQSILASNTQSLYIDMGPGKVLSGLIKKISPESLILSLEDVVKDDNWSLLEEKIA